MKLPDGWRKVLISDAFHIQLGKMLSPNAKIGEQCPYVTNFNVRWGYFHLQQVNFMAFSEKEKEKYQLKKGDLLICEGGEIGRCAIWDKDHSGHYYQKSLHRLRPKNNLIFPPFLYHELRYLCLTRKLLNLVGESSIAHLPKEKLASVQILCPSLPEQRRIAEFLGTWDEAIEKLERLIEAKEKRLSWIRANILTGKVRINGFSSKWKQIIFLEIASRVTRSVGKARVAPVSISAGKGFVLQEEKFGRNIAGKQYSKYTLLFPEEFTYNKGNSKTYECGCVYQWRGKAPVAVPNVFVSFSLNVKLADARFISHFFEADLHANELRKFINSGVRNDGLLNVTPDCFFKIILSLPELPEQKAIANILDTTSQEIDILRAELIMFQKQKRGLMQKLLTGVWRI